MKTTNWNYVSTKEAEELLHSDANHGLSSANAFFRKKEKGSLVFQKQKNESFTQLFSVFLLFLSIFLWMFYRPSASGIFFCCTFILIFLLFYVVKKRCVQILVENASSFTDPVEVIRNGKKIRIYQYALVVGDVFLSQCNTPLPCDAYLILEDQITNDPPAPRFFPKGSVPVQDRPAKYFCLNPITQTSEFHSGMSQTYIPFLLGSLFLSSLIFLMIHSIKGSERFVLLENFFVFFLLSSGLLFLYFQDLLKIIYVKIFFGLQRKGTFLIKDSSAAEEISKIDTVLIAPEILLDTEKLQPIYVYTEGKGIPFSPNIKKESYQFASDFEFSVEQISHGENADPYTRAFVTSIPRNRNLPQMIQYKQKDIQYPFPTIVLQHSNGVKTIVLRGDFSELFPRCTSYLFGTRVMQMDENVRRNILNSAEKLSAEGFDIILYAQNSNPDIQIDVSYSAHRKLTFIGFVAYAPQLHADTATFFRFFHDHKIHILLCTHTASLKWKLLLQNTPYASELRWGSCSDFDTSEYAAQEMLIHFQAFSNATAAQIQYLSKLLKDRGACIGIVRSENDIVFSSACGTEILLSKTPLSYPCKEKNRAFAYPVPCALPELFGKTKAFSLAKRKIESYLLYAFLLRFAVSFLGVFFDTPPISAERHLFFGWGMDLLFSFFLADGIICKKTWLWKRNEWNILSFSIPPFVFAVLTFLSSLCYSLLFSAPLEHVFSGISFYAVLFTSLFYVLQMQCHKISDFFSIKFFIVLAFVTFCGIIPTVGAFFAGYGEGKIILFALVSSALDLIIIPWLFTSKNIKRKGV